MEEIKQLQERLQALQVGVSLNRISESNVVEIVSKLKKMGLVNVLNSLDGKEYITLSHLEREVRDVIYTYQGRHCIFFFSIEQKNYVFYYPLTGSVLEVIPPHNITREYFLGYPKTMQLKEQERTLF